ncbi:Protein PSK SIMULATOR 1 [Linum perenne]
MGGRSSKNGKSPSVLNSEGNFQQNGRHRNYNYNQAIGPGEYSAGVSVHKLNGSSTAKQTELADKQRRMDQPEKESFPQSGSVANANKSGAEFYDGIPLYSSSARSRQGAVSKVSEVSSRLGRAGSVGLGKAVDVLDTLGSSMTNLNRNGGFASSVTTKGNELGILALEVANTIVKGYNLMQSLSKRNIRRLKEGVLPSEGIQNLVSNDTDELLRIVAADKRDEFKIFSNEVFRFGNRCKDPQWHNLDRYFEKVSKEFAPQRQSKEEAESVMEVLMILVQNTAELYQELQVLDKIDHEYQHKHIEDAISGKGRKGKGVAVLRAELKSQKKEVRNLKKKSLWSRSVEEVMGKLVDIVRFLLLEINETFGREVINESLSSQKRLGPVGLSLHYANMVLQIDDIVAQSSNLPPNARNGLYQSLPPSMKLAFRSRLQSFEVKEELSVTEIKDEMEKTLGWLVPMSTNTAKDHHGFGWVGEWANTGPDGSRRSTAGNVDFIRIESLHHADKEKTEAYILQLLLWLHHLVRKSSITHNGNESNDLKGKPTTPPSSDQKLSDAESVVTTIEEQNLVEYANGGSLETKEDIVAQENDGGSVGRKHEQVREKNGVFSGLCDSEITVSDLTKTKLDNIVQSSNLGRE